MEWDNQGKECRESKNTKGKSLRNVTFKEQKKKENEKVKVSQEEGGKLRSTV